MRCPKCRSEEINRIPNGTVAECKDCKYIDLVENFNGSNYEEVITEILVNHKIKKSGRKLSNYTIGEIADIRTECKEYAKVICDKIF